VIPRFLFPKPDCNRSTNFSFPGIAKIRKEKGVYWAGFAPFGDASRPAQYTPMLQ